MKAVIDGLGKQKGRGMAGKWDESCNTLIADAGDKILREYLDERENVAKVKHSCRRSPSL